LPYLSRRFGVSVYSAPPSSRSQLQSEMDRTTVVQRRGPKALDESQFSAPDEGPDHRPLESVATTSPRPPKPVQLDHPKGRARSPRREPAQLKAAEKVDEEFKRTLEQGFILMLFATTLVMAIMGFAFWKNSRLAMDKLVREEMELRRELLLSNPGADLEKLIADAPKLEKAPYRPGAVPVGGGNYDSGWYGKMPQGQVNAIKLRNVRKKLEQEKAKVAAEFGEDVAMAREMAYRDTWVREIRERDARIGQGRSGGIDYEEGKGFIKPKSKTGSGAARAASESSRAGSEDMAEQVQKLKAELERLQMQLAKQNQAAEGG
jgi:hypothetical protein